jgi:hypothetical protein
MNKKAEALDKFFADNKITCFQKEELNEKASPVHTVIYRAHMEEKGDSLPTMVVVDDTIYTMIPGPGQPRQSNRGEQGAGHRAFKCHEQTV